ASDIARLGLLVDELPLHPGREAGTAAAAQARCLHHLDERVGLHRERLAQPLIALMLQEEVEGEAVGFADVPGENWFHLFLDPQVTTRERRFASNLQLIDEAAATLGSRLLMPVLVVHHD